MNYQKIEREAFEASCKQYALDLTGGPDEWTRAFKYKYSHVQARFDGFKAGYASARAEYQELFKYLWEV